MGKTLRKILIAILLSALFVLLGLVVSVKAQVRLVAAIDEGWALEWEVRNESIDEAVSRLKTAKFSAEHSPRLAFPFFNSGSLLISSGEFLQRLETDPRIGKLLTMARKGTTKQKRDLLAAIAREVESLTIAADSLPDDARFWTSDRPFAALPYILAALDKRGETLGILVQLTMFHLKVDYIERPCMRYGGPRYEPVGLFHVFTGALERGFEKALDNMARVRKYSDIYCESTLLEDYAKGVGLPRMRVPMEPDDPYQYASFENSDWESRPAIIWGLAIHEELVRSGSYP